MILPKTILALIQDFIYLPFLPSSGQCMTEVQGRYRTMTQRNRQSKRRRRQEEGNGGREGKRERNVKANS